MDMFKKYNTSRYRSALETVIRELLKYNPLAIIEFIEMHFNETAILAHFNNEKCLKIHLDTLKQQLHQYKEKNGKTKTHEKFTKFTMEHASRIIKKGYDTFSKLKLRGGAGDEVEDEESSPPPPPPPEPEPDRCPICLSEMNENDEIIIHPNTCPMHKAHSACLRGWWRRNPICPVCRTPGYLPPPLPEEEQTEQAAILLEQQQAPLVRQWEQEYELQLEQQWQLQQQQWQLQQQQQRQAERRQWRNARIAFIIGLFGYVFYNLESIMEICIQVAMEVDPTMSAMEWAIGEGIIIAMLILTFIGPPDED
jgi:hypothetical protein